MNNNFDSTYEKYFNEAYSNIHKNIIYLCNNFFTEENKHFCEQRFDPIIVENRLALGKKNISAQLLSEKTNMTKQSVYDTLNDNRKPSFSKLLTLAKFFGISFDDFINKDLSLTNFTYKNLHTNNTSTLKVSDSSSELKDTIIHAINNLSTNNLEKVYYYIEELNKNNANDTITYK